MAQVYQFQVSLPVTDTMPRNRIVNSFHMQHVIGSVADTDLETMCQDIVALYKTKYTNTTREIQCKAYDIGPPPNYPRATVVANAGAAWTMSTPREICLVLSYAAENRGNKRERGRMYLQPQLNLTTAVTNLRPDAAQQNWALGWYTTANASLPDLGGVDWEFGVWSEKGQHFTQTQQAWVNDEWDVQRRRGLRETTRVQGTREG
jgi:hypothetical protein